jgi:membrane-bound lytic murein transglycosylase A
LIIWLRGVDLNHRPLGYEPNELPGCSTPHSYLIKCVREGQS